MIHLSNGYWFQYIAASGALSWHGRGWPWEFPLVWAGLLDTTYFLPITPTLTMPPRRGNLRWYAPWRCVRPVKDGFVNAKGLTNPGLLWWDRTYGPLVNRRDWPIIVSVYSDDLIELEQMAEVLNERDIVAVELNASCPNTAERTYDDPAFVVAAARVLHAYSRHPVIVKLSPLQDLEFLGRALFGCAQALDINSVSWSAVFPGRHSPFAHLGGGAVSGKAAQAFTWQAVRRLVAACDIPVIGPSVWEYDDIARLRELGAKAISFGSVFIRRPWAPTAWVRRDMDEKREDV